jgi:integrase
VQRQLGHADISTTVRYYGHLERGYLQDAVARTEAAVWSS